MIPEVDALDLLPFYLPHGDERDAMEIAVRNDLAVMLTGPTGCGKTRLVAHVAARMGRPLITVSCHDDLTSSDLLGRHLVVGGDVTWVDGPLTAAVRAGAICYLDEVAEARRDTLAALHSLLDDRRSLFLDRNDEEIPAAEGFALVASYNPESRSVLKELKPSFRQRFVTLTMGYLPTEQECDVVAYESGLDRPTAERLVHAATALRAATHAGVEAPSTRLVVATSRLVAGGMPIESALRVSLLNPLAITPGVTAALEEVLRVSGALR